MASELDPAPLYGTVVYRKDTERGYWGYVRPDSRGEDIWFCSAVVDAEPVGRGDRVAYIRHRYPPKPPKTNWSAYRVWRI